MFSSTDPVLSWECQFVYHCTLLLQSQGYNQLKLYLSPTMNQRLLRPKLKETKGFIYGRNLKHLYLLQWTSDMIKKLENQINSFKEANEMIA